MRKAIYLADLKLRSAFNYPTINNSPKFAAIPLSWRCNSLSISLPPFLQTYIISAHFEPSSQFNSEFNPVENVSTLPHGNSD